MVEACSYKPILCLDFDGVIHSYEHGWQQGTIYGTVTDGFFEWAIKAKELFTLVVYSSRSKDLNHQTEMVNWMRDKYVAWYTKSIFNETIPAFAAIFQFAHEKPPAFLTIDDRAITFNGDWNDAQFDPSALITFKPWMNK